MKLKFNKLVLSLLVFCLIAVGGGSYYLSQANQEVTSKKTEPQISQTKDANKNVSHSEKQLKTEKSSVQAPKNSENKTTNEQKVQKERQAFNKEVLAQDYYVENVDSQGKLTYVKATEKNLQELEAKAKDNQLSTYQVNHEGQMISVLTAS
ncbi:hypothetical protein ACFSJM_01180 [Lactococcus formosensis subsp. bovis]|uniref:hypothetical protein n=1 Tax=Lactococcus formosensis TaxID=1281486 RepID=UPI00363D8C50